MKQTKFISWVTLIALLLVGVGFTFHVEAAVSDTITKKFTVKTGGTLYLESDRGEIQVKTHDENTVEVKVYREAKTSSESNAQKIFDEFPITIEQDGNDVIIDGEKGDSGFNLFGGNDRLRIRYVVTVPFQYNASLETAGGSITVDDLDGEVDAGTAGGSLRFGHISGSVEGATAGGSIVLKGCGEDVDLKTAGGSIEIGNVEGDVEARTSGGSIRVGDVAGTVDVRTSGGSITIKGMSGSVEARTSGGSIQANITSQLESDSQLKTSAGNVTVYIPENIELNIKARTSGGQVHTDLPITVKGDLSKSRLEGTLNGGGPTLEMETSGGSVIIKKGREIL